MDQTVSEGGNAPARRQGHGIGYDPATKRMIVFGGCCGQLGDLWVLQNANDVTATWQGPIAQGTPAPGPRADFAFGYAPGSNMFLITGGDNASRTETNDLWVLSNANDTGTPAWSNPIPNDQPGSPPRAQVRTATYDPGQNTPFAFTTVSDLWVLSLTPKPRVVIVPGFGASTLTDSGGTDQWLSCSAISVLHEGFFAHVQYDDDGNSITALRVRGDFLAQNDTLDGTIQPSNQSILDCDNQDLITLAADSGASGLQLITLQSVLALDRPAGQDLIREESNGVFRQFNDLIKLSLEGYDPVLWPYDFRRDVPSLADELWNTIEQLSTASRPVVIITHSMGSVVAAALIQRHPDVFTIPGSLESVISMGAPFEGALTTYLYAQGWKQFVPFVNAANTKVMGGKWTSVYDLLPQWDFVTGLQKEDVFSGTTGLSQFPALARVSALPGAYELWSSLATVPPLDHWYAIIGSGVPTPQQIQNLGAPGLGGPCWTTSFRNGDGEVPLLSSQATDFVRAENQIYANQEHQQLPEDPDVIDGIVKILQGVSPFTHTCSTGQLTCGLQPEQYTMPPIGYYEFNACSPIDLALTNSAGESVGSTTIQIPGAAYTMPGGSAQIDVPTNDDYTLQAQGTGFGPFHVVIRQLDPNQQTTQTYVFPGIAAPGPVTTYHVARVASSISLVATFSSALADVSNALGLGLIDNQGIATSLYQKLQAAQSASNPARNNILNAFINQVGAQSGKHITGVAPQVFINDANSLMSQ